MKKNKGETNPFLCFAILEDLERISAKEFENSREIRAGTVKVILVLLILVFLRFGYGVLGLMLVIFLFLGLL